MIHPTRTNLLMLKARRQALHRSLTILRARRQALIVELLRLGEEFIDRHQQLAGLYAQALDALDTVQHEEGDESLAAIAGVTPRFRGIETEPGNILGIPFLTIASMDTLPRQPQQRPYTPAVHVSALKRSSELFEELSRAVIEHAGLESRVRRLSAAIQESTRIIRTLEDRILPRQQRTLLRIRFFLSEREREEQFRLRKFKQNRARVNGRTLSA